MKLQWVHVTRTWFAQASSPYLFADWLASMGPRHKDVVRALLASAAWSGVGRLQWVHVTRTWFAAKDADKTADDAELQWVHVTRTWFALIGPGDLRLGPQLQWVHVTRTWFA